MITGGSFVFGPAVSRAYTFLKTGALIFLWAREKESGLRAEYGRAAMDKVVGLVADISLPGLGKVAKAVGGRGVTKAIGSKIAQTIARSRNKVFTKMAIMTGRAYAESKGKGTVANFVTGVIGRAWNSAKGK